MACLAKWGECLGCTEVSFCDGKIVNLDRNPETMSKSINIVDLETEKERYLLSEKKNVNILNFLWALTFLSKRQNLIFLFPR